VAGDPSYVRSGPVDIGVLQVEDPGGGECRPHGYAGVGMDYAARLSCRSGGVEDEQRVGRVHWRCLASAGLAGQKVIPPDIASLFHGRLLAVPLYHHDLLYGCQALYGLIGLGLGGYGLAPAVGAVAGQEEPRLAVLQAITYSAGGKPGEDHHMYCPDLGAGQHGYGKLGDHGQIDCHPVALLDAHALQGIGKSVHRPVQLEVGDLAHIPHRLAHEDVGQLVAPPGLGMPLHGIVGGIDLACHEPLGKGGLPLQRLLVWLEPVGIALGHLIPEGYIVLGGPGTHLRLGLEALLLHPLHDIGSLRQVPGRMVETAIRG